MAVLLRTDRGVLVLGKKLSSFTYSMLAVVAGLGAATAVVTDVERLHRSANGSLAATSEQQNYGPGTDLNYNSTTALPATNALSTYTNTGNGTGVFSNVTQPGNSTAGGTGPDTTSNDNTRTANNTSGSAGSGNTTIGTSGSGDSSSGSSDTENSTSNSTTRSSSEVQTSVTNSTGQGSAGKSTGSTNQHASSGSISRNGTTKSSSTNGTKQPSKTSAKTSQQSSPSKSSTVKPPVDAAPATAVVDAVASAFGVSAASLKVVSTQGYMTIENYDELCWRTTGTSSAKAVQLPGNGDVKVWGNVVHLNDGISGEFITRSDLAVITANIKAIVQHYRLVNGVYQLRAPLFNANNMHYTQMSDTQIRDAWTEFYKIIANSEVSLRNGMPVVRVPGYSMKSKWQVVVQPADVTDVNANHMAYSTDNGDYWTDIPIYNSKEDYMGGMDTPPAFIDVKLLPQQSMPMEIWFFPPPPEFDGMPLGTFSISYSADKGFSFGS